MKSTDCPEVCGLYLCFMYYMRTNRAGCLIIIFRYLDIQIDCFACRNRHAFAYRIYFYVDNKFLLYLFQNLVFPMFKMFTVSSK